MLRSGLFSTAALAALLMPAGSGQQQPLRREGDGWVRTYSGTMATAPRLRVFGHGPVLIEGGASNEVVYTVKVNVAARTEAEAVRLLARNPVQVTKTGDWVVLTTAGGQVLSNVTVRAPRFVAVEVSTTEGGVDARGVDGTLQVDSVAGELSADRIKGKCSLATGGGAVKVGVVDGPLLARTGAGAIAVKVARGETSLVTQGGDISAGQIGGPLNAQTGGGGIRVGTVAGPVTASTGGGEIVIDKANGVVTAHNMAGPVQVGAADGVHCESGTGGVRLGNIAGSMRVSTSIGSIFANLLGSKLADSLLATGNGDITVLIPSSLRVTIRAENDHADNLRRIVSEFPAIAVRMSGTRLVAEGPLNGGGPLLQIAGTGGTIYLKRQ
ncbi:MAG TPA: hypothetical protein VGS58_13130 [Candidatus Sulfopaludibacter sp.]|nr:hypothetical protein [Candidatus Sulfopaludibacter sp.]